MPTEISAHGFCRALPDEIRKTVDMMATQFLAETWPVRFLALLSMLEDMTETVSDSQRPYVVNNWVVIVTGLLEHLPRDLSSPECLILMRHCALEIFRKTARHWTTDDEQQNAHLRRHYPQWSAVEDLLHEYEAWAQIQRQTKPH